jgi:putative nucleotidyltransferase with HDIG domain
VPERNRFVPIPLVRDVNTILAALDVRQPAVAMHCRRVAAHSVQLATHYGLPDEMVDTIRFGSLLHDIGKLMVPAHILSKPGRLTEQEWKTLQSHPERGFEMAEQLGFAPGILDIILYHHERNDGSGYPDGLDVNAIPWTVRIVSVMDAFDALTSPRTYREALSVEAARTLLAREAADRYCPWVVSGLLSMPRSMLDAVACGEMDRYRPDARPSASVLETATTPWTAAYLEQPGQISAW